MTDIESKEEIAWLNKMLVELHKQADSKPSTFDVDKEVHYDVFAELNEWDEVSEEDKKKSTTYYTLTIDWFPTRDTETPYSNVEHVRLSWCPADGDMDFMMQYTPNTHAIKQTNHALSHHGISKRSTEHVRSTYKVGISKDINKGHVELKKSFLGIYKKIEKFWEIETPRRQREKVLSAVFEVFPAFMNDMLLGDHGEEEG